MSTLVPFKAYTPVLDKIKSPNSFFKDVKDDFQGYLRKGFFKLEQQEAFYIHRIHTSYRSYTGITCYISLEDYKNGKILGHEQTIVNKEMQSLGYYFERKALIKPVLLTYPNIFPIDALINRLSFSLKPSYEFDFEGEHHSFWQITQPEYIEAISKHFAEKAPYVYIADGHHRMATSTRYRQEMIDRGEGHTGKEYYNYIVAELFPVSDIEIHNYNRIITSLEGLSPREFLAHLNESFIINKVPKSFKPEVRHQFGLYLAGSWYQLTVKPEKLATIADGIVAHLDVQIFNDLILRDILGVTDIRRFGGIEYLEGPQGTSALKNEVDKGKNRAAFNLFPVAIEDVFAISEAGGVLPPKSTWFMPRIRNGCIVQPFLD